MYTMAVVVFWDRIIGLDPLIIADVGVCETEGSWDFWPAALWPLIAVVVVVAAMLAVAGSPTPAVIVELGSFTAARPSSNLPQFSFRSIDTRVDLTHVYNA
jgi:hypothetical protein